MPRRQITGRTAPSRQDPTNALLVFAAFALAVVAAFLLGHQQGGESTVAEPPSAHAPADLVEEPAEAPVEEPLDVEPATEPEPAPQPEPAPAAVSDFVRPEPYELPYEAPIEFRYERPSGTPFEYQPIEPAETSERYTWIGPDTDGPFITLPASASF